MPSEKEIEEAIAIADDMWVSRTLRDAYLAMKAERNKLLQIINERSARWCHEEDSYSLDASRLAIKLAKVESERDKYKAELESYQRTYD